MCRCTHTLSRLYVRVHVCMLTFVIGIPLRVLFFNHMLRAYSLAQIYQRYVHQAEVKINMIIPSYRPAVDVNRVVADVNLFGSL